MANPMLTTIRRQNRQYATKQTCRGLLVIAKALTLGVAIYACYIAILGLGSL